MGASHYGLCYNSLQLSFLLWLMVKFGILYGLHVACDRVVRCSRIYLLSMLRLFPCMICGAGGSVLLLIFGLLYADDSFIFCWTFLGEFFQAYSLASAHIFNYDKSSILFSPRVNSYARLVIKRIFGFHEVSTLDRYLGLAAMVGRQRKAFIFSMSSSSG